MNIEEKVVKKLNEKNMLLTTAESCTAGMIASAIVNVSGASNVFHQVYITYCDEAKNSMLNVKKETLKLYTAVSPQTACEMALGALSISDADIAVSVTGVAGPSMEDGKPVGLVYIGVASKRASGYAATFDETSRITDVKKYEEVYQNCKDQEVLYAVDNNIVIVRKNMFEGDRGAIREKACKEALDMIYSYIKAVDIY